MATDPSLSARMRRFQADHQHRRKESSTTFIREKCGRCRDSVRLGSLSGRYNLCVTCRAELVDADPEEQLRWGLRNPEPSRLIFR